MSTMHHPCILCVCMIHLHKSQGLTELEQTSFFSILSFCESEWVASLPAPNPASAFLHHQSVVITCALSRAKTESRPKLGTSKLDSSQLNSKSRKESRKPTTTIYPIAFSRLFFASQTGFGNGCNSRKLWIFKSCLNDSWLLFLIVFSALK